jgi:SOS-response transcriptional repressor LexA
LGDAGKELMALAVSDSGHPVSISGRPVSISGRPGAYAILEAALPGREPRNIGIVLIDSTSGRGWLKLRGEYNDIADPDDTEIFAALEEDLRARMTDDGAETLLQWMEDTLSNVLRIGERREVHAESFTRALAQLYEEHVEPIEVRRFETHLPLYTLRAAAGRLGEEMPVEAEDWVPGPEGMKLDANLFMAHVVGHSMEPRIPDGSLNLFRFNPVGSRQGKIVLVERFGAADETARYTIKRYTSQKRQQEDGQWEHTGIRLEPLNPEFDAWDVEPEGFAVVAEWLRVIE